MHPEILRLMIKSVRRGRGLAVDDEFVCPPVPDYVDGSFRTEGTGALSADGHAPAAQHAA